MNEADATIEELAQTTKSAVNFMLSLALDPSISLRNRELLRIKANDYQLRVDTILSNYEGDKSE